MPVPSSSLVAADTAPPSVVVAGAKRARISNRKRLFAKELEHQLGLLRDLYGDHYGISELAEILDKAIRSTNRLSECTRDVDRDKVLQLLHTWDAIETDELEEEAELSRWCLDEIIKDLDKRGLIRITPQPTATPEGGRPKHIYKLTAKGRDHCDRVFGPQLKN